MFMNVTRTELYQESHWDNFNLSSHHIQFHPTHTLALLLCWYNYIRAQLWERFRGKSHKIVSLMRFGPRNDNDEEHRRLRAICFLGNTLNSFIYRVQFYVTIIIRTYKSESETIEKYRMAE